MNASIQRSRSPSPDRPKVKSQRHKELRYSFEDKTEEFDEEEEDDVSAMGEMRQSIKILV